MKKQIFTLIASAAFIGSMDAQAPRKVVVEDFTGIWCGYCPMGRTAAEHLETTFGASVINTGMHASDALANTFSTGVDNAVNNYGYPGGLIDRKPTGGSFFQGLGYYDGHDWDAAVTARLNTPAPVAIAIASTYNAGTRAVSITVTANYVAAASGNMNINCVLTEDSIATNAQQHNYMNADALSPWYQKGDPITSYYQRHTARTNLSSTIWGDAGIIPTTVTTGGSYNKTYTYTLPAGWNASHVHIVGFVSKWGATSTPDTNNIYIINANTARLGSSTTSIVEHAENGFSLGSAYPNPFSSVVAIPLQVNENSRVSVKVYNTLGVLVATLVDSELLAGEHKFYWAGNNQEGETVANGIYVYRVSTNKGSVSRTLMMNR